MVYDVNNIKSLENLKNIWLPQLKEFGIPSIRKILIGNKSDKSEESDRVEQLQLGISPFPLIFPVSFFFLFTYFYFFSRLMYIRKEKRKKVD